ncbi:MAG: hypothetical protein C0520_05730 [Sphingopyxis sp.]|nr:hypothetical protein [Sphingopyxis sp.]
MLTASFIFRAILSGFIVAAIAWIGRRNAAAAALLASLPLVSLLGILWLWHDTHDRDRLAIHMQATFFYVLPSLPMFLITPILLRAGVDFWVALGAGCALTVILYLLTITLAAQFGIKL